LMLGQLLGGVHLKWLISPAAADVTQAYPASMWRPYEKFPHLFLRR
jgi:hypothetical protein